MKICFKISMLYVIIIMCSSAFSAQNINSGMNDVFLTSSLGYDRYPCFLEWVQYDKDWKYFDSRTIRMTNETWIGCTAGDFDNDGYLDFITTIDNNSGYSHARDYLIDKIGSFRGKDYVKEVLPVEPWRHYSGIEFVDFNGDGVNDIVAVCNDKNQNRTLTLFLFDKNFKIISEKTLCDVSSSAWNIAVYTKDDLHTVYLVDSDKRKTASKLFSYSFDFDGNLKRQGLLHTFLGTQGKITGISVKEEKGKLIAAICGHEWDKYELDVSNGKTAEAKDKAFLLPNINLSEINSFLYKAEIKNGKLINLVLVEKLLGKRWQDVTFVKPFAIKDNITSVKYTGTLDCLHIMGLFSDHYNIENYFDNINKWYVRVENQSDSLVQNEDFSNIGKYKYVVINDVSIWALGEIGVNALREYINQGGKVLFINGLASGSTGGYKASELEKLMGIKFADRNDFDYTNLYGENKVSYIKGVTSVSAVSHMKVNDTVLFCENKLGKGKIYYLGLTPNTVDLTNFDKLFTDVMRKVKE